MCLSRHRRPDRVHVRDGSPSGARRWAFDSGSTRSAKARPRAAGRRPVPPGPGIGSNTTSTERIASSAPSHSTSLNPARCCATFDDTRDAPLDSDRRPPPARSAAWPTVHRTELRRGRHDKIRDRRRCRPPPGPAQSRGAHRAPVAGPHADPIAGARRTLCTRPARRTRPQDRRSASSTTCEPSGSACWATASCRGSPGRSPTNSAGPTPSRPNTSPSRNFRPMPSSAWTLS